MIIKSQSGLYSVKCEDNLYTCQLRGRLKRGPRLGDIVAVGDRVRISIQDEHKGMIEEVLPRTRMFYRMAPTPRGEYQQIIIANLDQAIFVFSCAEPKPKFRMLDRFLIIAEKEETPILIVANKIDLVGEKEAKDLFGYYERIGYKVLYTSTEEHKGLEEFETALKEKISLLVGPSGVGKSSLLNCIQPGLGLAVREVSKSTAKGKHTTVVRQLFPLEVGGYVADTPGLKALAHWDLEPEEVDGYFPEIGALVPYCQFNNCTHREEPGCAVRKALENGEVDYGRYDSYLRIRYSDNE